jgi:acyl-coenzyme A thioesterase PaaI-like protein
LRPSDPDFEQRTRASFARQGAMALIGARMLAVAPGRVEIELPFRADLSQQHGFFHAGMITAIAVGEVIRSGRTLTVCRLDAWVDKAGRRTHCATGTQTLMTLVGRAGVKD